MSNPFIIDQAIPRDRFIGRTSILRLFKLNTKKISSFGKEVVEHYILSGEFGAGKSTLLGLYAQLLTEQNVLPLVIQKPLFEDESSISEVFKKIAYSMSKNKNNETLPFDWIALKEPSEELRDALDRISDLDPYGTYKSYIEDKQLFAEQAFVTLMMDILEEATKSIQGVLFIFDDADYLVTNNQLLFWFRQQTSLWGGKHPLFFAMSMRSEEKIESVHAKAFRERIHLIPKIKRFTLDETRMLFKTYLKDSNIIFEDKLIDELWKFSNGLPYVIQKVGWRLYDFTKDEGKKMLSTDTFKAEYSMVLDSINELYTYYSRSFRGNEKRESIMDAFVESEGKITRRELIDRYCKSPDKLMEEGDLDQNIRRLREHGLITARHGHYEIFLPTYLELYKRFSERSGIE